MEMQPQKVQNPKKDEEDLLNFDLDDISLEDIDQQPPGQEEEVIDLTELVARGEPLEEKGEESAGPKLEELVSSEEDDGFQLPEDDLASLEPIEAPSAEKTDAAVPDVDDFALELDLSNGEKEASRAPKKEEEFVTAADLEALLKEEEPAELISEKDGTSEKKEEEIVLTDMVEGPEQVVPQPPDVIEDDLLKEEGPTLEIAPSKQTPGNQHEELEPSPPAAAAPAAPLAPGQPLAISEERLEAIVTKVVQDVVERVARETMCSVAERVIGEAIESLKKSLSENP